ncbi:hypothetical protein, partial [Rhizobium leguminosarum]|uniref:hypothetical protein n=1 Tax=Rhizobium leguminosarum TaxID=384 RepID=UPI001980E6D3
MFHEVPVRRSRALLITFEAEGLAAYDFLSRMGGPLNAVSMAILNADVLQGSDSVRDNPTLGIFHTTRRNSGR